MNTQLPSAAGGPAAPGNPPPARTLHATERYLTAAFAVAAGSSILIALLSFAAIARLRDDGARVAHTQEVIGALEAVLATATDAETAGRGYVITGSEAYLQPYDDALRDIGTELARIRELTADDEAQQRRLNALQVLVAQRIARVQNHIVTRREHGFEEARALMTEGRGRQLHDSIRALIGEMTGAERTLLSASQTRTAHSTRVSMAVSVAGTALAIGIAAAALVLLRRDFAGARRTQVALHEANGRLAERVAERTAELAHANDSLDRSYRELRQLVEHAPLAIAMFDRDMRYIAAGRRWVDEYGRGRRVLAGLSHLDVNPDIPERWRQVYRRCLEGEFVKEDEDSWVQADGSVHALRWAASPWRDQHGEIGGIIMIAEDLTPRKQSEARLRLADAVFMNTQEGIVITDLDGHIVAVNPAFCVITEYSEAEVVGQHMRLLQSGRQNGSFYRAMWESIVSTGGWQGEIWDRRKGGEVYPLWLAIGTVRNEAGEGTHYVGVVADISRMQHAQAHLQYFAHHDSLTGLPNRSLLYLRLGNSIERAARGSAPCAVLFLDLDGFKGVNDRLGHQAGDELLQLAVRRMEQRLRASDMLARLGGDEFVAVLERIASPEDAARVAEGLIEQFRMPFHLADGSESSVGLSIGISLFPADGRNAESLVRSADAALYRAKAAGRGTWRFAAAAAA